jgi:AcrR family transcriptional regulator
MSNSSSKIADNRKTGRHQVDALRTRILDAAEKLFLEKGIESTSMADISAALGISRVTMYRYFANRDEIAVEIQVRMLEQINSIPPVEDHPATLDSYRAGVRLILRNYPRLRDAYRYIGMFDAIYLDRGAENRLTQWTRAQLMNGALGERLAREKMPQLQAYGNRLGMILDTFTWVLEKLALRGEFTWSDPAIPMERDLEFFEKMIFSALDLLEQENSQMDLHGSPGTEEEI